MTARPSVLGWLVAVMTLWPAESRPATVPAEMEELGLAAAPAGLSAPDFTLFDLGGRRVQLTKLHGRMLVVNFWATWCTPCEMEMPSLDRLRQALADERLDVLAVNFKEPARLVAAFVRTRQLGFPILLDVEGVVAVRYQVEWVPFTVIVDRRGYVRAVAEGPREWDSPAMVALLRRLARESY